MHRSTTVMKVAIVILGFCLLLCACLSLKQPREKIEFYTLEYDPPTMGGLMPVEAVIKLRPFSVAPTYNSNRIIYRSQSFERDAYVYHRWRTNPGDLVTYFLQRDIQQSGLFKAVLPQQSRSTSSYVLEGSVNEFLEWDEEKTWKAVLSISVTLMKENEPDISKRILFQKTYKATKACQERNPRALAKAMSQAMAEISAALIMDTVDCLAQTG